MAKTCTYSMTGPSGQKIVLTGQAAIKAWLTAGGLEYLRGAANDARASSERGDVDALREYIGRSDPSDQGYMPPDWEYVASEARRLGLDDLAEYADGDGPLRPSISTALELLGDARASKARDVTETPQFKRWFGDSVMTETGEPGGAPLRLYHGGFPLMDAPASKGVPKPSARGSLGYGFYMTPDEGRAETYAGESGGWGRPDGKVTALYARLMNPLVIEHDPKQDPVVTGLVATGMPRDKAIKKVEKANEDHGWTGKELMSAAQKAGHDGVVFKRDGKISEVVVYQPTQVKSADGNDGSFSWNPDIRRSAERDADAVYKEMAADEQLIEAVEHYMAIGDAPEGALNDRLVAYMRRLPPVPADSYLTFYRNQPSWGKPWKRGWSSWTTNEDQTRFFGGNGFEVLKRKGAQGINLERLGEARSQHTGEDYRYGSQAEWLLLNDSVFTPAEIAEARRSPERGLWYSQLASAIESIPARLDNQSGVMWAQWLKANASKMGVKQDEVTWSGIEDFLKLKGKQKVSKEEIGAYLAEGGVRVEEVVLGGGRSERREYGIAEIGEGFSVVDGDSVLQSGFDSYEDAEDWINAQANVSGRSKYDQYTLPGGTNYREVLLTLPEKLSQTKEEAAKAGEDLKRLNNQIFEILSGRRQMYGAEKEREISRLEAEKTKIVERMRAREGEVAASYKSSHWDQRNVLAHIRLNDRVDADGKRVLLVEELQSDFGADTRKQRAAISKAVDEEFESIVERMKKAGVLEVVCE